MLHCLTMNRVKNMSQRKDIESLIHKNERRLQKLKEQKAEYGLATPPHILTQIEDTEAEIELLHAELKQLDEKPPPDRGSEDRRPVWQIGIVALILVTLGWATFTFFISPPPSPPSPTPNPPTPTDQPSTEPTLKQQIGLDETVSGTLYFNEANEWLFTDGPATVNIIVDVGPYGDALLMLLDANKVEREYVDAQGGREERLVNYTIPDDSDYTILVRNTKNEQTDYTLTVESVQESRNIGLDETVSGTLYFDEGHEWLFTDGPAIVNIILDVGPNGNALLMLFDSSNVQREYVDAQNGREERLVNYTIPDDSEYTIFVRNAQNEQTNYTLTVETMSN